MAEHISKQFDQELESIRARVLEMGGLVEEQIRDAIQGLITGDLALLDRAIEADKRVNMLEVELDESCQTVIARRQPAAGDMRMVFTVIKTITDLERIGDEAKKVARRGRRVHDSEVVQKPRFGDVQREAETAVAMLRKALDAFARLDAGLAAQVVRDDKQVDGDYKAIVRQLITYMMEDPRTISTSLEIMTIAKAVERIGDHAKNMAEYVVFMVKGKDIRHLGLEVAERTALSDD